MDVPSTDNTTSYAMRHLTMSIVAVWLAMTLPACGMTRMPVDCGEFRQPDCQQAIAAAQDFLGADAAAAEQISLQPFQRCAPDWLWSCPLVVDDVEFEATVWFHMGAGDALLVNVQRARPGDPLTTVRPVGAP